MVVLDVVDIFEKTSNDSLKEFLASRLLQRAGIFAPVSSTEDVAQQVRLALGATDSKSGPTRRSQLATEIRRAMDTPDVEASDLAATLQQAIDLAHVSALACALDQGEIGKVAFDEMAREKPFQLLSEIDKTGLESPSAPRTESPQLERALRQLQRLMDADRLPASRPAMLAGLAGYAPHVPDLPPESAAELASYLLAEKSKQEHELVLDYVVPATRWHNVRLALADQVANASIPRDRCVELISRVLQTSLTLDADTDWRSMLRNELLKDIVNDLSFAVRRQSQQPRQYNDARQVLFDLYATQLQLMGISFDPSTKQSPADLLRQLTRAQLESQSSQRLPTAIRDARERLLLELETANYIAPGGMARMLQWQRLWARTLALQLSLHHPANSRQAQAIIESLQSSDQTTQPLATHLRNGERALVELWALKFGIRE